MRDAGRAVQIAETGRHVPAEDAALAQRAHLLPNFDEYVVAYRDRSSIPALQAERYGRFLGLPVELRRQPRWS